MFQVIQKTQFDFNQNYYLDDINISKLKDIKSLKNALKIKDNLETLIKEDNINISEEDLIYFSDFLIKENLTDNFDGYSTAYDNRSQYYYSQDVYDMITKTPWLPVVRENFNHFDEECFDENLIQKMKLKNLRKEIYEKEF